MQGCQITFINLVTGVPGYRKHSDYIVFSFQAGITTTLNSRCSVLAAANSVFGRWDDTKGAENIDFMPTILSRFDMIFIVKDVHDEEKDTVSNAVFCDGNSCNSF